MWYARGPGRRARQLLGDTVVLLWIAAKSRSSASSWTRRCAAPRARAPARAPTASALERAASVGAS
ncbi:hypothetical protein [Streptomyces sp. Da 82-17]|uniref:hypothetical protein n=1 Tax=Streptomyces sp. Da 82-17 TaxID=3377116 RepID=UPI0038D50A7E